MEEVVSTLLLVVGIYLGAGFIFILMFIKSGLRKIDEGAIDTSWKFKLLIIPGLLVFWPIFLKKWMGAKS